MLKENTQRGDVVRATGWRGRTIEGVIVFKGRRALVCSETTRGSYKYEKLELISRTPDADLVKAVKEFVEHLQHLL